MTSKKSRHGTILQIMKSGHFHTQHEVASALTRQGFSVSQSTLSKDFKDLGVVKMIAPDGTFKYVLPQYVREGSRVRSAHREIEEFVSSVQDANNLVVITTPPGNASGVCETIDNAGWPELIGSIAGDNTILLICKTGEQAQRLVQRIQSILDEKKEPA